MITRRQRRYIYFLASKKKWSPKKLDALVQEQYHAGIDDLTKEEASALIKLLLGSS